MQSNVIQIIYTYIIMKLIDKEKVVAEIEKKLQDLITCKENTSFTEQRVDKDKIKEIDKRIERHQKAYDAKLRDVNRKAKDFEMTN